jgi:hypothetical protein
VAQPLEQRKEQENMKFKYSRRGVMTHGIVAKLNFNAFGLYNLKITILKRKFLKNSVN